MCVNNFEALGQSENESILELATIQLHVASRKTELRLIFIYLSELYIILDPIFTN